ncbi:MAG: hypothetical protein N4A49_10610 [Marinifilaceae bacterium]|jgi:hypothetical protein|nr:hypothetical protein [Marinifilaceae bacterium]
MKKQNFYFVVFLCLIFSTFIITSCSSDDDADNVVKNSFVYKTKEYPIEGAYAYQVSEKKYELGFYSEGISYEAIKEDGSSDAVGNIVLLSIKHTGDKLRTGDFDLWDCEANGMFINLDFKTGDYDLRSNPKSGIIKISENGNNTIIQYNLNLENGEVLKGEYRGIINYKND